LVYIPFKSTGEKKPPTPKLTLWGSKEKKKKKNAEWATEVGAEPWEWITY